MRALRGVALSESGPDLSPILPEALPLLADFLRKNMRGLKIATLQLLHVRPSASLAAQMEGDGVARRW